MVEGGESREFLSCHGTVPSHPCDSPCTSTRSTLGPDAHKGLAPEHVRVHVVASIRVSICSSPSSPLSARPNKSSNPTALYHHRQHQLRRPPPVILDLRTPHTAIPFQIAQTSHVPHTNRIIQAPTLTRQYTASSSSSHTVCRHTA